MYKGAVPGAIVGALMAASAAVASPSLNLQQALADTKSIISAGGQADVLVLGDSLSFRDGSYLPVFRDRLQQAFGNAGGGYQGFSLWSGAGFNYGWMREGINADLIPHHSMDGLWNQSSLAPQSVSGFPSQAYYAPLSRKVELHYLAQPGGGTFRLQAGFDGAIETVIDTDSAASEVRTFAYTLPAAFSNYTVQPVGDGLVTILGQNNVADQPGIRVHRAANGGWGVDNFIQRDATFDEQAELLGTDLVMIWLGQNDQRYDRGTYAQRLNLLVDRLQADVPSAEIVLVGTYDQGSPALEPLVEAMQDVAQARSLGFINIYSTAGDAAFFNAHGYLDDGVHFSYAGGDYLGNFLADAFISDGATLVPEPGMTLWALALAGLLARRGRRKSPAASR